MSRLESLKNGFVTGLLLIAPLAVTAFVIKLLVDWSLAVVDPVVQGTRLARFTANIDLAAQFLAGGMIVATITLLGYLATWTAASRMFGNVGRIVHVVPLVNTIYGSVRQVADALVDRDSRYESVVLVEYPREGLYSLGLVTADVPAAVVSTTGAPASSVFLPNSPNPTAGRLVLVTDEQIHEVDMSVREGMRLIVTTGIGYDVPGVPERFDVPGDRTELSG